VIQRQLWTEGSRKSNRTERG